MAIKVVLTDGTSFDAVLNGNTLYPTETVDDAKLTDANLTEVTIDGTKYENMTCANHTDEMICLREYTPAELAAQNVNSKIEYLAMMGDVEL